LILGGNNDTEAGYDFTGGYAIFLNQSIALEVAAAYSHLGENNNVFSIGTGFRIHFRKQPKR
jgi:hypothetical protein